MISPYRQTPSARPTKIRDLPSTLESSLIAPKAAEAALATAIPPPIQESPVTKSSCEIAESGGQRRGSGCGSFSGLYLWACKHHDRSNHECAEEEKDIRCTMARLYFFSFPFTDQIVSEWDDNA